MVTYYFVAYISSCQSSYFLGSKVFDLLLCRAEKCHLHCHLLLHLQVFVHLNDDWLIKIMIMLMIMMLMTMLVKMVLVYLSFFFQPARHTATAELYDQDCWPKLVTLKTNISLRLIQMIFIPSFFSSQDFFMKWPHANSSLEVVHRNWCGCESFRGNIFLCCLWA